MAHAWVLTPLLALAACSGGETGVVEITGRRVASVASRPARPGATLDQRFRGMNPAAANSEVGERAIDPQELPFAWDVPAGWGSLPATSMRLVNLRPAENPAAECYLSLLPGEGGGLVENVNRWRNQMGLDPEDPRAIEALPSVEVLGKPATLIDLSGSFQGMTGGQVEDARLVGVILAQPEFTLYVKMTGPADVVAAELEAFRAFTDSLRMKASETDPHAGHDHAADPDAGHDHAGDEPGSGSAGGFTWNVPVGWHLGSGSSMRLVTYVPDGAPNSECYVTVLGGDGGGLASNVNRWRSQFGMPALDAADLARLPTITALSQPAVLVEAQGPFTDMGGSTTSDQALLGLVCIRPEGSLFVKMIGPAQEIEGEREHFLDFVQSLEVAQ